MIAYRFTLSDDRLLQLEGSFLGSLRELLLGTELKDLPELGPECHPLELRLLSTYRLSPKINV